MLRVTAKSTCKLENNCQYVFQLKTYDYVNFDMYIRYYIDTKIDCYIINGYYTLNYYHNLHNNINEIPLSHPHYMYTEEVHDKRWRH